MAYLSPEIEILARRKKADYKSLIQKEKSCGIFQDYGESVEKTVDTNHHPKV